MCAAAFIVSNMLRGDNSLYARFKDSVENGKAETHGDGEVELRKGNLDGPLNKTAGRCELASLKWDGYTCLRIHLIMLHNRYDAVIAALPYL